MSYGEKRVWQPTDTWTKVAFGRYLDSRQWRALLELNPSYDIRYHPSSGTTVNLTGIDSQGKILSGKSASQGTLTQVGLNLDLRFTKSATTPGLQPDTVFPWDSVVDYTNRVGQYTAMSLLAPDRTNGFSLDSPQASSDTQRG